MTDRSSVGKVMEHWIETNLSQLSMTNPLHVHVDELLSTAHSRQDPLEALEEAFFKAIDSLGQRLIEVMPAAVIPLTSTPTLVCRPPAAGHLDPGSESPSIYLLHRDGAKALRLGELYRVPMPEFTIFRSHPDVFLFYETFRAERVRALGWDYTRTVLGEYYLPEHRTSWDSTEESP